MSTSLIGLFEINDIARKVINELTNAGCDRNAVEVMSGAAIDQVAKRLVEAGYDGDKAHRYGEALQKGGALIVAEVDEDKADNALAIMRRFDVLTPEALLERNRNRKQVEQTETAQVIEEELEIGKATTTGGKRLKTVVSEREVQETVSLREEKVDVERHRVERTLKPEEADKAFQERTIEMTETREKPVIAKQAHVIEEVALTKQSSQREQTVTGTVRRQDVEVEEIDSRSGISRKS
jgi:stress response protein YsnF